MCAVKLLLILIVSLGIVKSVVPSVVTNLVEFRFDLHINVSYFDSVPSAGTGRQLGLVHN